MNYINVTNIIHLIRIPKKGFQAVFPYKRIGRIKKLSFVRKTPRFYVMDKKKRLFDEIQIDNDKYILGEYAKGVFKRKKFKKIYLDELSSMIKSSKNSVFERIDFVRKYMQQMFKKYDMPVDLGGHRIPLVTNVLLKSFVSIKNREIKAILSRGKENDNIKKLKRIYFNRFGVGQVWGKRLQQSEVLSVWVMYSEQSDVQLYISTNDRLFISEHYILKKQVSKKLNMYSNEFREKLLLFVLYHGNIIGKVMNMEKRSRLVNRKIIGLVGWYPMTLKGEDVVRRIGKKKVKK